MLSFKKVLKEGSEEKSFLSGKKKKDQENYENKVKDFVDLLRILQVEFKNCFNENRTVAEFNNIFKTNLGPSMTLKERAFSRSNRVLSEMYKKLKKLDKNSKIHDNIVNIKKALTYTPKTSNGDYIKRSAMDNPKVIKCFNDIISDLEKSKK